MKNGNEGSEIRDQESDRTRELLRKVLPPVGESPDLPRDLWPAMLRRMEEPALHRASTVPWFDWALAGGLVAFAAMAPRTIPVILYYL